MASWHSGNCFARNRKARRNLSFAETFDGLRSALFPPIFAASVINVYVLRIGIGTSRMVDILLTTGKSDGIRDRVVAKLSALFCRSFSATSRLHDAAAVMDAVLDRSITTLI